jgi:hypothetical protein
MGSYMRSKTMGSNKTKYLRFYDKTNTWSADAKFDEEQHKNARHRKEGSNARVMGPCRSRRIRNKLGNTGYMQLLDSPQGRSFYGRRLLFDSTKPLLSP